MVIAALRTLSLARRTVHRPTALWAYDPLVGHPLVKPPTRPAAQCSKGQQDALSLGDL